VSLQGPRCSIRSKKMYSDITIDYIKMTLLNLPAVLLVTLGTLHAMLELTRPCASAGLSFCRLPVPCAASAWQCVNLLRS